MEKITPNLWFGGDAEEAADFYVGLFPDSRIISVHRASTDNPSAKKGDALLVEFILAGRRHVGINGWPASGFSEAVSLQIHCEDQAEVDYYWDLLTANGGEPGNCGWCKGRFGSYPGVRARAWTGMALGRASESHGLRSRIQDCSGLIAHRVGQFTDANTCTTEKANQRLFRLSLSCRSLSAYNDLYE